MKCLVSNKTSRSAEILPRCVKIAQLLHCGVKWLAKSIFSSRLFVGRDAIRVIKVLRISRTSTRNVIKLYVMLYVLYYIKSYIYTTYYIKFQICNDNLSYYI